MAKKKVTVKVKVKDVGTGQSWESESEFETDLSSTYTNQTGWMEQAVAQSALTAYRELSSHIINGEKD